MKYHTQERVVRTMNGWLALPANIGLFGLALASFILGIRTLQVDDPNGWYFVAALVLSLLAGVMLKGFFTLQPNNACVLTLFGHYVGTERASGFHWTNPFVSRTKITLRARNFNGPTLKVNDKRGNPIEIGAVVVWRVEDTAKACFDVDYYTTFVEVQSESALRQLAASYAYDDGEQGEKTLRSDVDEVSRALRTELMERLAKAGVTVLEARLSHLAYASEIAGAMLRRQQAEAVIAARKKIVHGAVSMVEMAIDGLKDNDIVDLDEDRKAAMVSNLLVVLCSEHETQPIVNTGSVG